MIPINLPAAPAPATKASAPSAGSSAKHPANSFAKVMDDVAGSDAQKRPDVSGRSGASQTSGSTASLRTDGAPDKGAASDDVLAAYDQLIGALGVAVDGRPHVVVDTSSEVVPAGSGEQLIGQRAMLSKILTAALGRIAVDASRGSANQDVLGKIESLLQTATGADSDLRASIGQVLRSGDLSKLNAFLTQVQAAAGNNSPVQINAESSLANAIRAAQQIGVDAKHATTSSDVAVVPEDASASGLADALTSVRADGSGAPAVVSNANASVSDVTAPTRANTAVAVAQDGDGPITVQRAAEITRLGESMAEVRGERVTLNLSDLGEGAKLDLHVRGRRVDARIAMPDASTLDALRTSSGDLRQALHKHGLEAGTIRLEAVTEAASALRLESEHTTLRSLASILGDSAARGIASTQAGAKDDAQNHHRERPLPEDPREQRDRQGNRQPRHGQNHYQHNA